jgi:ClpP class serine protease
LAAPFAVLGSIGVLGQTINIQKTLEGWGIRPLVFKGGKDKAPVGLIGDITRDGMAKVQQMIDKTHVAFKQHVSTCRPMVASAIEEIATGDIWLGYDALGIGLVDRITTSDEYIGEKVSEGALVLKLVQMVKGRSFFQKPATTSEIRLKDLLYRKASHAAQDLDAIVNGICKGLSLLQDDDETLTWAKYLGTDIRLESCNQRC